MRSPSPLLAAAAVSGLTTPASAAGELDNSAFDWSVDSSNPESEFVFLTAGAPLNTGQLPTAVYTGAGSETNSLVTYRIIGSGVSLYAENVAYRGGTRPSIYYDFGNGVYFNKSPHFNLLSTGSTASETVETTYTLRATSFYSKYSERTFKVTVVAPLSIEQTSTMIALQIGASSVHPLTAATGGDGVYTYSAHAGVLGAPSTLTDAGLTSSANRFRNFAPIEFDADALTIQLIDKLHSDPDYRAEADADPAEVGSYEFTLRVTDGIGHEAMIPMTVFVSPTTLSFPYDVSEKFELVAGQAIVIAGWAPNGGVAPYTWSIADLPSGWTLNGQRLTIITEKDDPASTTVLTVTITDSSPDAQTITYTWTIIVSERQS